MIIPKASLLAGVRFALAMYCRETGYSSHDCSFRTGFGALEMIYHLEPVPPPCTPPPHVQTYRRKDAYIDIEHMYGTSKLKYYDP